MVYHFGLAQWLYVVTSPGSAQSFFAYRFGQPGSWIWANNAWGWYHDFGDPGGWSLFE